MNKRFAISILTITMAISACNSVGEDASRFELPIEAQQCNISFESRMLAFDGREYAYNEGNFLGFGGLGVFPDNEDGILEIGELTTACKRYIGSPMNVETQEGTFAVDENTIFIRTRRPNELFDGALALSIDPENGTYHLLGYVTAEELDELTAN